jgi:hypothetical protein
LTQLDAIIGLLIVVIAGLLWVASEIQRVYLAVEPIASSRAVRLLSEI